MAPRRLPLLVVLPLLLPRAAFAACTRPAQPPTGYVQRTGGNEVLDLDAFECE